LILTSGATDQMKNKIIYILLLSFINIFSQTGKVINIKDGDTVVILDSYFKKYTVRVADIDCPEKKQPFGNRAKQFTSEEILGKTVFIKVKNIDRYGRTVGYVMYDDKNLSFELLKNGLAWHSKYYSKDKKMAAMEQMAKDSKIGLWIDKKAINPYEWRKGKRNK
jgi:micrococcal nuclease